MTKQLFGKIESTQESTDKKIENMEKDINIKIEKEILSVKEDIQSVEQKLTSKIDKILNILEEKNQWDSWRTTTTFKRPGIRPWVDCLFKHKITSKILIESHKDAIKWGILDGKFDLG